MSDELLILVADDQLGVRRLIQEIFRGFGYRLVTVANGREAIARVEAELPALVLLDIKMPMMDGLETLRALKGRYPDLPVLMMTAVGDSEQVNESLACGAVGCVNKPFDVFELRQLVQRVLEEGKV